MIKNVIPSESFNPAYYIAAARELFEEVGIFLGSRDHGLPVPFSQETKLEYRRQLVKGEVSFLQILKQEGLHLNLEFLKYFGNIVTPERRTYRFDTRFFLAKLPQDQSPEPDLNEIDEGLWIAPDEALSAYENETMSLVPATILALRAVIKHQHGEPLVMPDLNEFQKEFNTFLKRRENMNREIIP